MNYPETETTEDETPYEPLNRAKLLTQSIRAWDPVRHSDPPFQGDIQLGVMPGLPPAMAATLARVLNSLLRRQAPATYLGFQPGFGSRPGFHLYNLLKAVPGHSAGSTVSEETLRRLGYRLPPRPGR